MLALVAFVAGMQFNVPVSTSFVLEGPITIIAGVNGVLVSMVVVMVVVVVAITMAELLVHQRGRGTC